MEKVIPLDEVEEPVKRFFERLDVSNEASLVKVNGKHVYLVVRSASDQKPFDEHWTDEKNHRRYELIDKEIAQTITPTEAVELEELTQQMRRHRDRVAPLPLDHVRQVHDDLILIQHTLE